MERLRHAVIAARSAADRGSAQAGPTAAGDEITALVSSWSWERAEQVARAFTVYFHLVNLAEEEQRVRTLRLRDSGDRAPRESLADAVGQLTAEGGAEHLAELLAGLRVHPVFTAHPTEARRRAVVASLRRVSGLLTAIDDQRAGAAQQAEDAQEAARGGRPAVADRPAAGRRAWRPADEVRSVMTAFDETLFRLVPDVYRALDHVLLGAESGAAPSPVPPFLRFGSWVGGDRDGNPNVTAAVTREAAMIQAEHALRGLEAACGRIGRALTVYQDSAPAAAPSCAGRSRPPRPSTRSCCAEITARSPGEPYRAYLLYATERLAATRTRNLDLAYGAAADFLADLRLVQSSLAAAGAVRQAYGELQHLIWQAETFGFHLAGLEVRQHSQVHARALAELRAGDPPSADDQRGAGDHPGDGVDPAPLRRGRLPPLRHLVHHVGGGHRGGVRAGRATRSPTATARCSTWCRSSRPGEDLANAPSVLTGMLSHPGGDRAAGRDRAAAGGDARLLGLGQGARARLGDAAAVRRPGGAGGVGGGARRAS